MHQKQLETPERRAVLNTMTKKQKAKKYMLEGANSISDGGSNSFLDRKLRVFLKKALQAL
jgi:hypothetical protein